MPLPARTAASYLPQGEDFGIGLCYQGVKVLALRELEVLERQKAGGIPRLDGSLPAAFRPNYAATFAPYPVPDLGGVVLALPVCFGCLTGSKAACGGLEQEASGLVLPKGNLNGRI